MTRGSSLQKWLPINGDWENGECAIDLTSDIEEDKSLWVDLTIIGRIVGPKLSRAAIKEWIAKRWVMSLVIKFIPRGLIKFIPRGFFVVVFTDNSKRDKILCKENWFVRDHLVYIQPWSPNFNPLPLAVYDKLVWIRLYNIPIEYWGDQSLEKIGRSFRTLLEIDDDIVEKDLYTYAWLKIAAVKEIPTYIFLISSEGKWKQQVEIEKDITVCNHCGSRFHSERDCILFVRRAWRRSSQRTKPKKHWAKKNKTSTEVLCLP
ncbi:hypothetical protein SUGI_0863700 [Cryptomeria japonica]|nr:hypothetical protein SUGI_0863700 [Cryptomeria japonica]